jgi:hypothetical protein
MTDLLKLGFISSLSEHVSIFVYAYDEKLKIRELTSEERDTFWSSVIAIHPTLGKSKNLNEFPLSLAPHLNDYLLVLHLSKKRSTL